jgi:Leucine-rich repeat (LRR) protein
MTMRKYALLLPALLSIAGCSHNPYTITFNDNVLYSPNAARSGVLQDPSLQGCLNQMQQSTGVDDLEAITLLACPGAGVLSLAGIDALPNLEQLELSDNAITNLGPLVRLKNLRVLSIRNNAIGNINPLDALPILRFVALDGNNGIPCRQLDSLEQKLGNTLSRPQRCAD